MKKALTYFIVLSGVFTGKLQAQIASFNFSGNAVTVDGWTNMHGDPTQAIITVTAGGVTISSVATTNWVAWAAVGTIVDGLGNGNPGGFFPGAVMSNDWLQQNGSRLLAQYNVAKPQLQLSGLNKDATYTLRMSGSSRAHFGTTQYNVFGLTDYGSQLLDCHGNSTQGVTFLNVQPDVNGVIKVYVNGYLDDAYPMISGLQLFQGSAGFNVPNVTITAPANGATIAEGGNVVIKATATEIGSTISKVEFYAGTVKIGEVATAPYNFTWNNPDPGNYQINVKATDATGTTNSATTNIAIKSLNNLWSTTGNSATDAGTNFVGTVDNNAVSFRTNNIERMRILNDGSVGIGTSPTSGYLLAVKGTALFTRVQVKAASNWPDYVFNKTYRLRSLEDLENYIGKYKHLPEIIPAGKAKAEGFDVATHQAAILKKVEELTLYLIDENKQLKVQVGQIAEQNKKLGQQDKQIAGQGKQIAEQDARFREQQRQIDELKALLNKK